MSSNTMMSSRMRRLAFVQLTQLFKNAFKSAETYGYNRVKQLANIKSVEFSLYKIVDLNVMDYAAVSFLLSHFPRLEQFHTNDGNLLPYLTSHSLQQAIDAPQYIAEDVLSFLQSQYPQLQTFHGAILPFLDAVHVQQVIDESQFIAEDAQPFLQSHYPEVESFDTNHGSFSPFRSAFGLQQDNVTMRFTEQGAEYYANHNPALASLKEHAQLELFRPAVLQSAGLKHLCIRGCQKNASISASVLTGLVQLARLTLLNFIVTDAHQLTQLNITHLIWGSTVAESDEQLPTEPIQWPALTQLELAATDSDSWGTITESTARAILPLPHPGFTVVWPDNVHYVADVDAHPLFGYMGAAHMTSMNQLYLHGFYCESLLQALVSKQVSATRLDVYYAGPPWRPMTISSDKVPAYLAFPTTVEMLLDQVMTDSPEFFRQLFLVCPQLKSVSVPALCLPEDIQVPAWLDALRYEVHYADPADARTTLVRIERPAGDVL